jgi:pimeloyl-ACP methyl ester carboxylesterase
MPTQIPWHLMDKPIADLATDISHEIQVQREAIPIVFVPGIMGSRLRLAGSNGQGNGANGLPNMRWDPGNQAWMVANFTWAEPPHRKNMLVGASFSPGFLEADNSDPVADGFQGIMHAYRTFLVQLRDRDWGPLGKIFQFPVYAFGYNWTDSNDSAGAKLAGRIKEIIEEAKAITGSCEKVILVTHSMGGLVARSASELHGASGSILGIIHGVQPVTGAPAAYWRMKAGFEGFGATSATLGNSGPNVTCVLANIPGGLQLLPNKSHRSNAGIRQWLFLTEGGNMIWSLPRSNPYEEIYRVPAVVLPAAGEKPSTNRYWGLVDPNLLDPGNAARPPAQAPAPNDNNGLDGDASANGPWTGYLQLLAGAESFHDSLGMKAHAQTCCFHGIGNASADAVELRAESNWVRGEPYATRSFRGLFRSASGSDMQAVLQNPNGDGDGTVPASSGNALQRNTVKPLRSGAFALEHQPAFENAAAQQFTVRSIIALCEKHYRSKR